MRENGKEKWHEQVRLGPSDVGAGHGKADGAEDAPVEGEGDDLLDEEGEPDDREDEDATPEDLGLREDE